MTEDLSLIEDRADSLIESHNELLRDLIKLRTKHRLSQETIAERMGVTQPTVASFERYDANPTLATIRRYALAVGARIRHEVIDDCGQGLSLFNAITTTTFASSWSKPSRVFGEWIIPETSTKSPGSALVN